MRDDGVSREMRDPVSISDGEAGEKEGGASLRLAGWSRVWPTEPGEYLFHGHRKGDHREHRMRLRMVSVRLDSMGGPARFTEGQFFYESEQFGMFKRVTEELPTEADLYGAG